MKEKLREKAWELGFDACRFTSAEPPGTAKNLEHWLAEGQHGEMAWLARNAEKRTDPQRVLPGAKSIVCLAVAYHDPTPPSAQPGQGIVAAYAAYQDYHDVLRPRLEALTAELNAHGSGTRSLSYVDTGPILERDIAQRAGVGFVGKHTNLISRELGNWFFLAEILTTLELEPDAPERNRCGTCTRCLQACPTNAITAPFQLDARRCISYLTIELKGAIPEALRPLIGTRIYGCDDCLAACPWNRFARAGAMMKPFARADLRVPQLLELLALDEAGFKRRFAGTPMLRTKRRGILRNVCVALGNLGDPAALPALDRAALDPEPLIAEHACWARDQIIRSSSTRRPTTAEDAS